MVYRNIFHIIWYNITIWYDNIAILYGTQLIITYNTVGLRRISFFSEICSLRSVTNLFAKTHPPPPQKHPPRRSPYRLVYSNGNAVKLWNIIMDLRSQGLPARLLHCLEEIRMS